MKTTEPFDRHSRAVANESRTYSTAMIVPELSATIDFLNSHAVVALANAISISAATVAIALSAKRALAPGRRNPGADIVELRNDVVFRFDGKEVRLSKADARAVLQLYEELSSVHDAKSRE